MPEGQSSPPPLWRGLVYLCRDGFGPAGSWSDHKRKRDESIAVAKGDERRGGEANPVPRLNGGVWCICVVTDLALGTWTLIQIFRNRTNCQG